MIEHHQGRDRVTGFYRGKVVAHSTNGKCKIFWPGVTPGDFEDKPDELPDAEQAAPLFASGPQNNGVFFYPDIGTFVWGFFANEDVNYPVYFASSIFSDSNSPHYSNIATDSIKEKNEKIIRMDGVVIVFNSNANTFSILSDNGSNSSKITMNGDGNIEISCTGKISLNANEIEINSLNGGITITGANGVNITAQTGNAELKGNCVKCAADGGSAGLYDNITGRSITTNDVLYKPYYS